MVIKNVALDDWYEKREQWLSDIGASGDDRVLQDESGREFIIDFTEDWNEDGTGQEVSKRVVYLPDELQTLNAPLS